MGHCGSKDDHHQVGPSQSANALQKYDLSDFAVITVIFNPIRYKSRYEHYQKFKAHMSKSGIDLITVECIFESAPRFGLPQQNFEITRVSDRHHIQLRAPSIIWMKENLINIAIERLPRNIEYVAWLDADIEFESLDWPQLTITELQRYPIVQLFELSFFLGPEGKKDILRRDYSFGYSIRHNKPIEPGSSNGWYAHPGYAWAMRRSTFNLIGGLLDFCIIGSGDLHFAFALLHRIEETLRPGLHQDYRKSAITWGDKLAQLAQNGAKVGYVPVNLWHHWHGARNDRSYVDRWTILEKHQFSPLNDLEKDGDTGLIRLAHKKKVGGPEIIAHIEALEGDIVAYFKSRNEDSTVKINQAQRPSPVKAKPSVAAKTQRRRGRPDVESSDPADTNVDDDNPDCGDSSENEHHHDGAEHHDSGDEHHHHHHDDEHHHDGAEHHDSGDEHHHHHHDDEHHHHQTDDQFGGHHSSHEQEHHGGGSNVDNSGHNYDPSSGSGYDYQSGGRFGNTDYGGPGSFY